MKIKALDRGGPGVVCGDIKAHFITVNKFIIPYQQCPFPTVSQK